MLGAFFAAVLIGAVVFVVVKIARMTKAVLKTKIAEKLKNKTGTIDKVTGISVAEVLKASPEISLEDFGKDVEANDYLFIGVKDDMELETQVDIIRADTFDDDVVALMKKHGGMIKVNA